ncbi:uncharacterized protein EKO05_0002718 [Ascochyta rabiei]|uniref:uncharacterized protein n=1 Tax=Didymella rabiei TaxID=5454 RepID=UPI0022010A18|nr:uncharacterized protein EKO05_0002718 [Ascochyta rabiei]UPX12151.1 hypothetical protein EKO05_0002718 [Ascochyta rabiei]
MTTTFALLYPISEVRKPISSLYLPFTFLLTLVLFLLPNQRRISTLILPVLAFLCLDSPCYTFGNPSAEYYQSSAFVAMPVWFVEFAIVRLRGENDAPVFVGRQDKSKDTRPKRLEDCRNVREKLFWASALMFPSHRGIGWNWQIKNVPHDPNQHLKI